MDGAELIERLESPSRGYGRIDVLDEVVRLYTTKDTSGIQRLYEALVRAQHLKPNPAQSNDLAMSMAVDELEEACAAADAYWPHRHDEKSEQLWEFAFSLGGPDQDPGEIRKFFRRTLEYQVPGQQN